VLVPALQTVGLVGDSLDMEIFHELAAEFSKLDFHLYAKTLDALGRHDAKDVLETVRCPVLIITGDRDAMTPVATAREMASTLDDAQLHIIERASHYAAVEHPEVVGGLVEAFLERLPGTTAGALERTERFLSSSTSTTSSGAADDSSSKDRDDS
jgi:pimeloyl-ACP methyl ester carboxylesterase